MFRQFRPIKREEFILCFVDTASGGLDYTAAQFISKTNKDVPLVYHSKVTTVEFTNKCSDILNEIYNVTRVKPIVAYERNNGGSFEIDRLAAMNYDNKYEIFKMPSYGKNNPPESTTLGWSTNSATRPQMLSDLKNAIDNKVLRVYDKQTITELYSFVVVKTSSSWKAQAESNAHDDLVMSLAGAWQMYQICDKPLSPSQYQTVVKSFPEDKRFKGGIY